MTATVLITRPDRQARAFADQLVAAHGGPVRMVISPLIEIVSLPVDVSLATTRHVIFTSVNGVLEAARLGVPHRVTAWCVGGKTAQAARDAGFDVRDANGNSRDLVALIMAEKPASQMMHIHGHHVTGDIAAKLTAAGIQCRSIIAYNQVGRPPTQQALDVLSGQNAVIVPLFSPRTANLFAAIPQITAPVHLVQISEAVHVSNAVVPIKSMTLGGYDGMVSGTLARYARFSP